MRRGSSLSPAWRRRRRVRSLRLFSLLLIGCPVCWVMRSYKFSQHVPAASIFLFTKSVSAAVHTHTPATTVQPVATHAAYPDGSFFTCKPAFQRRSVETQTNVSLGRSALPMVVGNESGARHRRRRRSRFANEMDPLLIVLILRWCCGPNLHFSTLAWCLRGSSSVFIPLPEASGPFSSQHRCVFPSYERPLPSVFLSEAHRLAFQKNIAAFCPCCPQV